MARIVAHGANKVGSACWYYTSVYVRYWAQSNIVSPSWWLSVVKWIINFVDKCPSPGVMVLGIV